MPSTQLQPDPDSCVADRPTETLGATATAPKVDTGPRFETTMEYCAPTWPLWRFPLCVSATVRFGGRTSKLADTGGVLRSIGVNKSRLELVWIPQDVLVTATVNTHVDTPGTVAFWMSSCAPPGTATRFVAPHPGGPVTAVFGTV